MECAFDTATEQIIIIIIIIIIILSTNLRLCNGK